MNTNDRLDDLEARARRGEAWDYDECYYIWMLLCPHAGWTPHKIQDANSTEKVWLIIDARHRIVRKVLKKLE